MDFYPELMCLNGSFSIFTSLERCLNNYDHDILHVTVGLHGERRFKEHARFVFVFEVKNELFTLHT